MELGDRPLGHRFDRVATAHVADGSETRDSLRLELGHSGFHQVFPVRDHDRSDRAAQVADESTTNCPAAGDDDDAALTPSSAICLPRQSPLRRIPEYLNLR